MAAPDERIAGAGRHGRCGGGRLIPTRPSPGRAARASTLLLILAAATSTACGSRAASVAATARAPTATGDSAAIREAIERGARGFERGDPDAILAHYGRDVVLSYPGVPDQDYETLARAYRELRSRPASVTATTRPTFDEILVSGDLAIVRVRWTTTIRSAATDSTPAREATRWLRDLQVWRRDAAGDWKFIRGMHYRDSTAAPRG